MLLVVHAAETKVKASHKAHFIVYDHHLFMVAPKGRDSLRGMSTYDDVSRKRL